MLCYKDMTFCDAQECKNFNTCDRAYTYEVRRAAEKWYGDYNPPIALFGDPSELPCHEPEGES